MSRVSPLDLIKAIVTLEHYMCELEEMSEPFQHMTALMTHLKDLLKNRTEELRPRRSPKNQKE